MKAGRILETALDAAEAFYTRVLGLKVKSRVVGRHVFFYSGDNMFLVFNPSTTEKESDPHGARGRGHVAWACDESELDPWKQWLIEHGVAVRVYHWPQGGRSLYFSDPAGNSLEITTPQLWGLA
jgi:catechol 2,3-dioxygenase-like lactoylglutathione lyase family enzyme